jgi:hypothetical protein
MPTAVKMKATMAGAKRKAETIKEGPSKGSKKPKIDSVQSLKTRTERNGTTRPEKTDAVARRLIAGALRVRLQNKIENQGASDKHGEKETKIGRAQATKTKCHTTKDVKIQAPADSSDDELDSTDEDGGVALEQAEDSEESDESEKSPHTGHHVVHPDRVKANANGAGPNGMIIY